jgi:DNA-binding NtrC family response regulator
MNPANSARAHKRGKLAKGKLACWNDAYLFEFLQAGERELPILPGNEEMPALRPVPFDEVIHRFLRYSVFQISNAMLQPPTFPTMNGQRFHATPAPRILLLEDEVMVRKVLRTFLKSRGMVVFDVSRVEDALRIVATENLDVCILDYQLEEGTAFDFLRNVPVEMLLPAIILSGHGTIGLAVEAVKLGVEHFLTKPVDLESLLKLLDLIFERQTRDRAFSINKLRTSNDEVNPFVGTSRAMNSVKQLAQAVVDSLAPILILGETGTGKSVLARWLHAHGPRASAPFVDLNCAGLTQELAEADLFGHQKGAFTGASTEKKGLLEIAHGGDVFLDEIGDLDIRVQPKLLKVLEERTFRRVGDVRNRQADVRIMAATHRDLIAMSEDGHFRQDLLFRINTVTFKLPPLRERKEDLAPLAEQILHVLCRRTGRSTPIFSDRARATLESHSWPGNMRELRNSIERALLFCHGDTVDSVEVPTHNSPTVQNTDATSEVLRLVDAERQMIERALSVYEGRVDQAAQALDIPRSSLYAKIRRFGLKK